MASDCYFHHQSHVVEKNCSGVKIEGSLVVLKAWHLGISVVRCILWNYLGSDALQDFNMFDIFYKGIFLDIFYADNP